MGRVFADGLGDLGSILGRVIPKTLKWYLIPPCLTLSNIRYISRVKWSNPGKDGCNPIIKGSSTFLAQGIQSLIQESKGVQMTKKKKINSHGNNHNLLMRHLMFAIRK